MTRKTCKLLWDDKADSVTIDFASGGVDAVVMCGSPTIVAGIKHVRIYPLKKFPRVF